MAPVASTIIAEHGPIATLTQHGRELNVGYREDRDGGAHFDIAVLGGCLADAPLGEVGLTRGGMLYPALTPDAELLGFDLTATGGEFLMRCVGGSRCRLRRGLLTLSQDPLETIPIPRARGRDMGALILACLLRAAPYLARLFWPVVAQRRARMARHRRLPRRRPTARSSGRSLWGSSPASPWASPPASPGRRPASVSTATPSPRNRTCKPRP